MFYKSITAEDGRDAILALDLGEYDLRDTMECGQCFRYELIAKSDGYVEYLTVVDDMIITVGQKRRGELIFYGAKEKDFVSVISPYFSLETDYGAIRRDITERTDSEWLKRAAQSAGGIAILKQDPWETVFSFIISQNNNIPRIRKIIKRISAEYGVNITLHNGDKTCPAKKTDSTPCEEICKECGICYTFPKASDVHAEPQKLLSANPGFRYKYLCDAAEKVSTGAVDLDMIAAARSYEHTKSCLMQIRGVGEKVASCAALFGFGNLEAFPIDVWMKKAIDKYFDGRLDPTELGRYAGVAQQYIFHYIRNIESHEENT